MKAIATLLATATLALGTPALAQQAAPTTPGGTAATPAGAPVKVGDTVHDTAGGVVGTIASVDAQNAVVDTGTVKAPLALASFTSTPKGPIISLTRAQLEAAIAQQTQAALTQKLVVGAIVRGPKGDQVGTVESITGDQVVVTTPDAKAKAQLARSSFAPGPDGVVIGLTPEQLQAAVAQGAKSGATTGTTTPSTTPSATTPGAPTDGTNPG